MNNVTRKNESSILSSEPTEVSLFLSSGEAVISFGITTDTGDVGRVSIAFGMTSTAVGVLEGEAILSGITRVSVAVVTAICFVGDLIDVFGNVSLVLLVGDLPCSLSTAVGDFFSGTIVVTGLLVSSTWLSDPTH